MQCPACVAAQVRGGFAMRVAIAGTLGLFAAMPTLQWTVASVATSLAVLVAIAPWVAGDLERIRRASEKLDALPDLDLHLGASGATYRG